MATRESLTPLKLLLLSFNAGTALLISYLPLLLEYRGLNATEIGWVLAIGPFTAIFSQPLWGYLSDKFKTVKRILMICILFVIIVSMIFFQMDSLIPLLITASIFYFFSSPIEALSDSMAQRRAIETGITFGSIRSWGALGFAFSSLIVGEILTRIGIQYMIWPYLFFASIALVVIIRLTDVEVSPDPVQLSDAMKLIKNKSFIFFLLIIVVLMVTNAANDYFMGLYIVRLGGSERWVGLAWFIGVMSEATIYATARYWFRKYHPLIFVILAGILFSVRWFLYAKTNSPILIISLQFLHGLTFGIYYIAAFDYITRLIPRLMQSTGHLIFFASMGVSGIIGSLVGGNLFNLFGGSRLYFVLGCIALLGTFCMIVYHTILYRRRTLTSHT